MTESPVKTCKDEMYGKISSSSESDSESNDRLRAGSQPLYFNNEKDLPIFHSDKYTYTTDEIVKILWSATEDQFKALFIRRTIVEFNWDEFNSRTG